MTDPVEKGPVGKAPGCRPRPGRASRTRRATQVDYGPLFVAVTIMTLCLTPCLLGATVVWWAVTLGLPLALGIAAALVVPQPRVGVTLFAAVLVLSCTACMLLIGDAGVFCGAIYTGVSLPTAVVAANVVQSLRKARERQRAKRGDDRALWLLIALALPLGLHTFELVRPPTWPDEALVRSVDVEAPIEAVWAQSLSFADFVAPLSELISAPLPRAAIGSSSRVGDEKTLRFDKGLLRVRIVRIEAPRTLVAEVIEQTIERRALLLRRVTVSCVSIGRARTRAEIRLDFEPRMGPRRIWRPAERLFGGLSFDAVLSAWKSGAEASPVLPAGDR